MSLLKFNQKFFIEKKEISRTSPPFLVAEIGLNHNNNLELGKRTIQAAARAGAHAVKFQTYKTEEFIDSSNSESKFLFDIFKQYELSEDFHIEFQRVAKDEGMIFFSTPLCESAVDLLVSLDVPVLKIASGDIVNKQLLNKVCSTQRPIFLSTGASRLFEVTRALEFLLQHNIKDLCLFHCVSMYPAPFEKMNLQTISFYQEIVSCPIGFSDHSSGSLASSIAVGLGACVIEKHFTLDKSLPGPDHSISLDPNEWKQLSESIQLAYVMRGEKSKILHEEEKQSHFFGRRSLYQKNNEWIALRPAQHLKDSSYSDSWYQRSLE